jgi:hypothetical protein
MSHWCLTALSRTGARPLSVALVLDPQLDPLCLPQTTRACGTKEGFGPSRVGLRGAARCTPIRGQTLLRSGSTGVARAAKGLWTDDESGPEEEDAEPGEGGQATVLPYDLDKVKHGTEGVVRGYTTHTHVTCFGLLLAPPDGDQGENPEVRRYGGKDKAWWDSKEETWKTRRKGEAFSRIFLSLQPLHSPLP